MNEFFCNENNIHDEDNKRGKISYYYLTPNNKVSMD